MLLIFKLKRANQFWLIVSMIIALVVLIVFIAMTGSGMKFFERNTGCGSIGGECVADFSSCHGDITTYECDEGEYCCLGG